MYFLSNILMTVRETHSQRMNELHKFVYILCACAIFIFIYWFIMTIICWESYKKNSRKKISSKPRKKPIKHGGIRAWWI